MVSASTSEVSAPSVRGPEAVLAELVAAAQRQVHVPPFDELLDVAVADGSDVQSRRYTKLLQSFARHGNQVLRVAVGDVSAKGLVENAVVDGFRNIPHSGETHRAPFVDSLASSVNVAASEICQSYQLLKCAVDLRAVSARRDEVVLEETGGEAVRHPWLDRWVWATQRVMLLPVAAVAFGLTRSLAGKFNEWPSQAIGMGAGTRAASFWSLGWFAGAVVFLGLLSGLSTAARNSREGRPTGTADFRLGVRSAIFSAGASVSSVLGLLIATGGAWQLTNVPIQRMVGAIFLWALLGAAGFCVAYVGVALSQDREIADSLAVMFSKIASERGARRAAQADETLARARVTHDVLIARGADRAAELADVYYLANLRARRNSRTRELDEWIARQARSFAVELTSLHAVCVCTKSPARGEDLPINLRGDAELPQ